MGLRERLANLEQSAGAVPMLTLNVDGAPTAQQAAVIAQCTASGRRLIVFCMPGDSAWMPDCGAPPWEVVHGNA